MSVEIRTEGPIPVGGGKMVWRAKVIDEKGNQIDTFEGQSQSEINEYVERVSRLYREGDGTDEDSEATS